MIFTCFFLRFLKYDNEEPGIWLNGSAAYLASARAGYQKNICDNENI